MRLSKIELDHPHVPFAVLDYGVNLNPRVLDDAGEVSIVHDEPREPQPRRADQPEKVAIMFGLGNLHSLQRERSGSLVQIRWRRHFEVSDDGRQLTVGDLVVAHFQVAAGGRLMRIASILPPVLRPNRVPRSYSRLNST